MNRIKYSLILCLLLNQNTIYSQNSKYHLVEDSDIELITDLYNLIKNSESNIIISPFVVSSIDYSYKDLEPSIKPYGFDKKQFKRKQSDTLLIRSNRSFNILEPDTLIKYSNIKTDTSSLFTNPLINYINDKTGKNGICYFKKIIYSHNKEFALAEYWIYCGFLCGKGELVLLKKTKLGWIKSETLVISTS